ncbi:hypothetical protein WJX73_007160 [Symbiochloris irregularis]|uniref:Patatin n=1 Tax=Symbiochloris irregularis TaxID=706552 RepID=A0AAW1NPW2_9CHLO
MAPILLLAGRAGHGCSPACAPSISVARSGARDSRRPGSVPQAQVKTENDTAADRPSSSVNPPSALQALLARLSSDTTAALANIVPVTFPRASSLRQPHEAAAADDAATSSGIDPEFDGQSASRQVQRCGELEEMQQVESQIMAQLEVQERQTGVQKTLQQWKRSALQQTSDTHTRPQQEQQHPVLEVLQERMQSGSKPGARKDKFKLGLAVEGGGMRGSVTAGMLRALHNLGARDVFDAVYGSSAGAINLTYFLSGQPEGVDIYHEDIANERFCNMRRLFKRNEGPALDLSFLLEDVMCTSKPLDWDAVMNSSVPLKVVASCLDTLQPIILEGFTDENDLRQCLRASAQVPAVAGDPVLHRGRRMVDAAVFEAVPFRAAVSDGCTHVLTLCSRPPSSGGIFATLDDFMANLVKKAVLSPAYMKAAWQRELENLKSFGLTTDQMVLASLDPEAHQLAFLAGSHSYPVIPGANTGFSPICIDASAIRVAAVLPPGNWTQF